MVTKEQVRQVAELAKLDLSAEEVERFSAQLTKILDYVGLLNEVEGLPESEPLSVSSPPARADQVRESLPREEVLALAPKHDGETMLVPPVIE